MTDFRDVLYTHSSVFFVIKRKEKRKENEECLTWNVSRMLKCFSRLLSRKVVCNVNGKQIVNC